MMSLRMFTVSLLEPCSNFASPYPSCSCFYGKLQGIGAMLSNRQWLHSWNQAELNFQPFKNLSYSLILSLLPKFPLVGWWYVSGKLLRCNWISWWQAGDWSFKGAEFHKALWKDCYTFVLLGTCRCLGVKSPACTAEDLQKKGFQSPKKEVVKFRSQEAWVVKSPLGTHPRYLGQLLTQAGSFQEEMARIDQKMLEHIKQWTGSWDCAVEKSGKNQNAKAGKAGISFCLTNVFISMKITSDFYC